MLTPFNYQIRPATDSPAVDQLDVSSSAEEDISPVSDDEVDELLEDETDGDMEYYDEEPPTTPLGTATTTEHPSDTHIT